MFVTKASLEKVPFNKENVINSIKRAGIPDDFAPDVLSHIESIIYDGIPTHEIYRHILEFLGKSGHPHTRIKYALKRAIMDLGPSGFPFEKFIAAVLNTNGFTTQVGQIIPGKCVSHEIDVIADKNDRRVMVECKFHNQSGTRSDVKVALYVEARFYDVRSQFDEVWLITNTKFTSDAIKYGTCAGVKMIGWGYPEIENLQYWIEKDRLYPVTTLSTLDNYQKRQLLSQNTVLCRDLAKNSTLIESLGLSKSNRDLLENELQMVSPISISNAFA